MKTRLPIAARVLAVAAAVVSSATAACSDDDDTDGSAGQRSVTSVAPGAPPGAALDTVQDGKLTACTGASHVPFAFKDDGTLDGIDIELVRAVAGRLALQADFRDVGSDREQDLFNALDAGQCDIVASSVPVTEDHAKTVDFSAAYFRVDQSLLVRKGDESLYGDLDRLKGRTIGVLAGTAGARFARKNAEGATVKEYPRVDELFAALRARQVDGVLQSLPVNAHRATATGESVVVKTFDESSEEQYGFALRKGRTELKRAIDDALAQVKKDDTYPTILRRFLGDTAGQI